MNSSITVTHADVIDNRSMTLVGTDLDGDTHIFNFRHNTFYSNEMARRILDDLANSRFPFLTCGYVEARDVFMVSDDAGNQVMLSRFSDWR